MNFRLYGKNGRLAVMHVIYKVGRRELEGGLIYGLAEGSIEDVATAARRPIERATRALMIEAGHRWPAAIDTTAVDVDAVSAAIVREFPDLGATIQSDD